MKQILMSVIFSMSLLGAEAQAQNSAVKKPAAKKSAKPAPSKKITAPPVVSLNSEGNYPALGKSGQGQQSLRISDPFITIMNNRAKGVPPPVKNVELLGMPKGVYGFANGRLKVFPSSTTSNGTLTGMGSVATGSNPGTMGSIGTLNANGKSPFAGSGMWGNALGLDLQVRDTVSRRGF